MSGCYLCQPTGDEEPCEECERAFFENPVVIVIDEEDL